MKTYSLLLLMTFHLAACGSPSRALPGTAPAPAPSISPSRVLPTITPTPADSIAFNYTDLMGILRSSGVQVEASGDVTIPFFSVSGHLIRVNGSEVQIFEFDDPNTASIQLTAVQSARKSMPKGTASPEISNHIYKKGRVIAVYRGDDRNVENVLENILGSPLDGG